MKIIGSSYINKQFGAVVDKLASKKFVKSECTKNFLRPETFAASFMVTSIVSKDLVGCVIYTTQSWNNKKIPEKNRKFVAMTDLMNGIVMVGGQFLAGKIIDKKLSPIIIGKTYTGQIKHVDKEKGCMVSKDVPNTKAPFHPNNVRENFNKVIKNNKEALIAKGFNVNDPKAVEAVGEEFVKKFSKDGKAGKAVATGFGLIIAALGTTALVKRTLAPFISTPLASEVKRKFIDPKDARVKAEKEAEKKAPGEEPLDHTVAPWNHTSADGDQVTIKKPVTK